MKNNPLHSIPDERLFLREKYLKNIKGDLLFVGVADYTVNLYNVNPKVNFTTIDFNKERACYGSPYKHITGDYLLLNESIKYDHICLFGVLGHQDGPNSKYNMFNINSVMNKSLSLLKSDGVIVLGPSYIATKKHTLSYWEKEISELEIKFNILKSFKGPRNLILYLSPKINEYN
jgi:hypothetical protein